MNDKLNEVSNNNQPHDDLKQKVRESGVDKFKKICLGFYLIIMTTGLAFYLFKTWPPNPKEMESTQLLLLVIIIGALGSSVHAATSFASFVGNRTIVKSWYWWYILRPFIGMALALVFYFVVRGGFLSVGADSSAINLYGIAALAGLVGMFSKQATDKLRELFDNIFKTKQGDELRKDKLDENLPVDSCMLSIENITYASLDNSATPTKNISIQQLADMLKGVVTRIPLLDSRKIVKYVIHQSLLYKFIAQKTIDGNKSIDLKSLTLEDFLKFNQNERMVSRTLAFVSKDATLGIAKELMEQTKDCQDIFITEHGSSEEPMLGWLTNIEISRRIKTS